MRIKLLNVMAFVPDRLMLLLQYRMKTGRRLDLKNPQRYSEKLQWYKLYYRDPLMKQCADKYEVRRYIEDCGCAEILNEVYGVYDSADEVPFDRLPNEFVLKDTLGGGGDGVIIVRDKSRLDIEKTKKQMTEWTQRYAKKHFAREWVYEGGKHRIIVERYIASEKEQGGLIDYKFFCFFGKVKYLYVIADREVGKKAGFGIFDAEFNKLHILRADEEPLLREIPKPGNFELMKRIAENLSKPFPHARIDLYNCDSGIVFGEVTFFDGSGYMTFEPDEFDYELGKEFILPERSNA
ncbi:MAG: carbonic anhydrase [Lachnospiraceae bacterium]|nr:carbonic anhydrase [Lachnospiraceae bacterium]